MIGSDVFMILYKSKEGVVGDKLIDSGLNILQLELAVD